MTDDEIADLAITGILADQAGDDLWAGEDAYTRPAVDDPAPSWGREPSPTPPPLFTDVAALLAGGLPEPPAPVLLTRDDGHRLFYAGKVNVLFGDPESGKTWVGDAAVVEALQAGRRAAIIDLDHNGATEIVQRLVILGASPAALGSPDLFRLYEPEDGDELVTHVRDLVNWRPAAVLLDSLGELLPMMGKSSNSPDDFTEANRRAVTPLANAGAAVIVIDHLPKSDDARAHGQTGTMAKKRAINGASYRVTLREPFAPGKGGACGLVVEKDRPGGVRAHCPGDGKNMPAGLFVMTAHPDGTTTWRVTTPRATSGSAPDADVAELDGLLPPPRSQRDVQERCGWGGDRAMRALRTWRELRKDDSGPAVGAGGAPDAPAPPLRGGEEERSTYGNSPGARQEHPGARSTEQPELELES